jgi:predicted esterase
MNIIKNDLRVTKTARIIQFGELNETTIEVWIVLHGYAQLATEFIKPFECIATPNRVILAPEGLNRFYAKGFGGKPAATWMTAEERETEIKDYLEYLDQVYKQYQLENFKGSIRLLGFSQGVATASRWLVATSFRIDDFIIYAGELASELINPVSPKLTQIPLTYITGNSDPMIAEEKVVEVKKWMQERNARIIVFNGGHHVVEEALLQLV